MQRRGEAAKSEKRFCSWCETLYSPESGRSSPLCPNCRAELLQESKEFLVDLLGHVAGVNAIAMDSLRDSPDLLEELDLYNEPQREGTSRHRLTMQELARKRHKVQ